MEEMDSFSVFVAGKIRCAMKERGMTQASLAENLGCTQQYVSKLLKGRCSLSVQTLLKAEAALGLDIVRYRINPSNFLSVGAYVPYNPPAAPDDYLEVRTPIRCFGTGDRPFSAICSDENVYLCKYTRFSGPCYGLAREYVGSTFALCWGLTDLPLKVISMKGLPVVEELKYVNRNVPGLGRLWLEDSYDLTDLSEPVAGMSEHTVRFILLTALFDLWLANEDRVNNNMNLLCGLSSGKLSAIDHAGIFNTSFSAPLSRLDYVDSILYSDMYNRLGKKFGYLDDFYPTLQSDYLQGVSACKAAKIVFPPEWKIPQEEYDCLKSFIFSDEWLGMTWDNFMSILKKVLR